jgi:hypothetical protein
VLLEAVADESLIFLKKIIYYLEIPKLFHPREAIKEMCNLAMKVHFCLQKIIFV